MTREPRSLIRSSWERLTFYGPAPANGGYMEVDGESELPTSPQYVEPEVVDEPPMAKVFDDEPDMIIEGTNHSGHFWKARGRLTEDGFIVYAGSIANNMPPSFLANKQYFPLRRDLMVDGIIDENGIFAADFVFKSASQAACVIAAAMVQAAKKWHTEPDEDGVTMTYAECHPKVRERSKAERKPVRVRKVDSDPSDPVVLEYDTRKSDGTLWHVEWRGNGKIFGAVSAE